MSGGRGRQRHGLVHLTPLPAGPRSQRPRGGDYGGRAADRTRDRSASRGAAGGIRGARSRTSAYGRRSYARAGDRTPRRPASSLDHEREERDLTGRIRGGCARAGRRRLTPVSSTFNLFCYARREATLIQHCTTTCARVTNSCTDDNHGVLGFELAMQI